MTKSLPERDAHLLSWETDYRLIGRLSIGYMIAIVGEVLRRSEGDFMDVLIVATVYDANGDANRGVSRNAISRTLNIPLETVRRRINALIDKKVLDERHDGVVLLFGENLGLGNNAALAELNAQQLRQLFHALKAHGIRFE